jgi:hypothetical protein
MSGESSVCKDRNYSTQEILSLTYVPPAELALTSIAF